MVYGCGNKCVKYLVFFFNLLFCVAGAAIMGVSIAANTSGGFQNDLQKALDSASVDVKLSQLTTAIWVLVGVGALIFVTGFLGCCGAATENRCLLGIFFVIVLILFIAELACGIAVLVLKNKVKEGLTDGLKEAATTSHDDVCQLEEKLKCCIKGETVQCCSPGATAQCADEVWNYIKKYGAAVGGVAIGLLVIELLAMIFSCILCTAAGRRDGYYA